MNDTLTDITVILDRSGSMSTVAADTIGGLRAFVADQKALPGAATFALVQFDNEYEVVRRPGPIAEVDPSRLTLVPRGSTALLDAVGRAINETGSRLGAMQESDRPAKVVMVILTDGEENSSREFARDKVFSMITHQREVYGWHFLFLGANQDAIAAGAGIGITRNCAMSFSATEKGLVGAFNASSDAVRSYRSGTSAAPAYSQADRDKQDALIAGKA